MSEVQGVAQDLHPQAHRVWHFADTSGQRQLASFKSLIPSLNSEGSGSPCYFRNVFPCCTPMINIPLAGAPVLSARFQQRTGSVTQGSVRIPCAQQYNKRYFTLWNSVCMHYTSTNSGFFKTESEK